MRLAQKSNYVTRANIEKYNMNRRLQLHLRDAIDRLIGMGYAIDRERMTLTRGRAVIEYGRGFLIEGIYEPTTERMGFRV